MALSAYRAIFVAKLIAIVFLATTQCAIAEKGSVGHVANLPIGTIFPTPTGIVFPGFNIAAGVNPAALPRLLPTTSVELSYSPSPGVDQTHDYFASFAKANKQIGFGAGYLGSMGTTPTQGAFAGLGFRTQTVGLGIDLRNNNIGNDSLHSDLGLLADYGKDFEFGLVLHGLDSSPRMDVGLGFGRDKNYTFEINLLFPAFNEIFGGAGSNYVVTVASNVNISFFGFSFKSSYSTATSEVTQTVSALVWIGKTLGLTLQYSSPNRSYFGILLNF